jgi:hypothetical protein
MGACLTCLDACLRCCIYGKDDPYASGPRRGSRHPPPRPPTLPSPPKPKVAVTVIGASGHVGAAVLPSLASAFDLTVATRGPGRRHWQRCSHSRRVPGRSRRAGQHGRPGHPGTCTLGCAVRLHHPPWRGGAWRLGVHLGVAVVASVRIVLPRATAHWQPTVSCCFESASALHPLPMHVLLQRALSELSPH